MTQAPRAGLPRLGGGTVDLPGTAALNLLVFWKSSCPTCRWVLPFVERLHARTAGVSLAVVGVAEDDEAEAGAAVAEAGVTFPTALEAEPWAVSAAYELMTVPTFVLADAAGRVLMVSPGFAKDDLLEVARRAAERDGGEPADPFGDESVPAYRPG